MILETTLDGKAVWVLAHLPVNADDYAAKFSLPVEVDSGLTNREARWPVAARFRINASTEVILKDADLSKFRNFQQAVGDALVALPFWPLAAGSPSPYLIESGCWVELAEDFTPLRATIGFPTGAVANRLYIPLIVGKLAQDPDPRLEYGELARCALSLVEDSALSWIDFLPQSFTAGPSVTVGLDLFPFRANWATAPVAGGAEVIVERKAIGDLRERQTAFWTQVARRGVSQDYTFTQAADWVRLMSFVQMRGGKAGPFWLPAAITDARLLANVAPGDTSLSIDEEARLGNNLWFCLDDLNQRVIVKRSGGGNPVPLTGVVGAAFLAKWTRLESAIIARLASDEASISWSGRDVARVSLNFKEVSGAEYTGAETIGNKVGRLDLTTTVFEFTFLSQGTQTTQKFTSFEFPVRLSDGSLANPAPFEFSEIRRSLNLDRSGLSLTSRIFSGSPLAKFFPFVAEWPLEIVVREVTVSVVEFVTPTMDSTSATYDFSRTT